VILFMMPLLPQSRPSVCMVPPQAAAAPAQFPRTGPH